MPAAWVGAGAAALGAYSSYKSSKGGSSGSTTTTQQQEVDPRIASMLFGPGGNNGLLNQWTNAGNPQSAGQTIQGRTAENYLANYSGADSENARIAAYHLMNGNASPFAQGGQAQNNQAYSSNAQGAQGYGTQALGGMSQGAQAQGGNPIGTYGMDVLWNTGEKINAPGQNNLGLADAYKNTIYGDAGANPYLNRSLAAGADLSNAAFNKTQGDLTQNFQRNILPSIRGGAIAAGQYGGSRQGIAEGNAISDLTNQLSTGATQQGLANSANIIGAQANSFNQGQDRSLSALNTLSGQQYGTASTNAQLAQQANLANQAANQQAVMFNATQGQNAAQFNSTQAQQNNQYNANLAQNNGQYNAGLTQANNQYNASQGQNLSLANAQLAQGNNQYNATNNQNVSLANAQLGQNNNQFNAQLMQGNNQYNASNQLQTNNQNNSSLLAGSGLLSSLMQQQSANAGASNNYGLNQAQQISGLLSPYIGLNGSSSTTSPYFTNTAGNILGGATAGLGLYNQFRNLGSFGGSTPNSATYAANDWFTS